eukprot:m.173455 g.173455  ORF g.173455 m.173455 type:complete len:80 (-) comp13698_c0_seq1:69-308(-)
MHPLVRDLYKRIIVVGREYPGGLEVVRRKAKEHFRANAHLTEEEDIRKAVSRGRWYVNNELVGVIKLKKYRTMAHRYGS